MQGSIAFDGTLSGSIAGGGGGGSDVTITPTLTSGTKIADYDIDGTPGELYAPDPEALTAAAPLDISSGVISIDLSGYQEKLTAGSYISIDSDNEISCNPPIKYVWYTPEPDIQQDILIGKFRVNGVTQNVYAPAPVKDYSTTIHKTGRKWIDGSDVYEIVLRDHTSLESTTNKLIDITSLNIKEVVDCKAALIDNWQGAYTYTQPFYNSGTVYFCVYYVDQLNIQLNYSPTVGNGRAHDGYQIILECTLN